MWKRATKKKEEKPVDKKEPLIEKAQAGKGRASIANDKISTESISGKSSATHQAKNEKKSARPVITLKSNATTEGIADDSSETKLDQAYLASILNGEKSTSYKPEKSSQYYPPPVVNTALSDLSVEETAIHGPPSLDRSIEPVAGGRPPASVITDPNSFNGYVFPSSVYLQPGQDEVLPTTTTGDSSEKRLVGMFPQREVEAKPEVVASMSSEEIPSTGPPFSASLWNRVRAKMNSPQTKEDGEGSSRQAMIYLITFIVMAGGLAFGALSSKLHFRLRTSNPFNWNKNITVAFAGNAYLFVNDVPRVLEAIANGQVYQDSVVHSGGSLYSLLKRGNGMYESWQTEEAYVGKVYDADSESHALYDFGMCTVAQLLQGYDKYLQYGNAAGVYYDDGKNPCLMDEFYLYYLQERLSISPPSWDYVILVDQTKRMAIESARSTTVDILTNSYGPLLNSTGAIPVIVDTHAFWSDSSNMTGLDDIPTFTAMIQEGVDAYVSALKSVLPRKQAPLVAPIGLAYLTVWEEDYDLWVKLFLDDQTHSSVYGTYLFSCVLYSTLFGHLPDPEVSLVERVDYLFAESRTLMGQNIAYPNYEEVDYLRKVARRVALWGHVPKSLSAANNRQ